MRLGRDHSLGNGESYSSNIFLWNEIDFFTDIHALGDKGLKTGFLTRAIGVVELKVENSVHLEITVYALFLD